MSLNVVSNYAANVAQRYLEKSDAEATRSLAKLTAGTRVLNARDDAAAMAVGQRMRTQVTALKQAAVNAGQAASMLQIADGTMGTVTDMLVRAKSLATQSASDNVGSAAERAMLDVEYQKLMSEITRVANLTKFDGQNLLNGTAAAATRSATVTGGTVAVGGAALSASNTSSAAVGTYNLSVSAAQAYSATVTDSSVGSSGNLTGSVTATPTKATGTYTIRFEEVGASSGTFRAVIYKVAQGGTYDSTTKVAISDPTFVNDTASKIAANATKTFSNFIATGDQSASFADFGSSFSVSVAANATSTALANADTMELKLVSNDTANVVATLTKVGTSYTATSANIPTSGGTAGEATFTYSAGNAVANMGFAGNVVFDFGASAPAVGTIASFVVTETAARTASTSFQYQLGDSNSANDSITVAIDSVLLSNLALTNADGTSFSWVGTHSDAAGSVASSGSGLLATGNNLLNRTNASKAIDALDRAVDDLSKYRANIGAQQNRFEFAAMNIQATVENQEAARSNLMDLDVAAEMSYFTSRQILQQAGVSMLAQANQMPQNLLRLFR